MAVLGLCCCVGFSLVAVSSFSLVLVCGLLTAVLSLAIEHGLWSTWTSVAMAPGLWDTESVVVAQWLSCSTACGIFLDQGSNLCPMHWQADS